MMQEPGAAINGQRATPALSKRQGSTASRFGSDEMRDFRLAAQLKAAHRFLHYPVGVGDALMLAEMLHPRIHKEGFDDAAFIGGVLINAPAIGAVAAALVAELFNGSEERFAVLWTDAVFDGDQHRTTVLLDVLRDNRRGPMHRRRQVEARAGLQLP